MQANNSWEIELPEDCKPVSQAHLNKVGSCRRRIFTTEEDKYLAELVSTRECTNWFDVAARLPGRTPRQCRDRWINYLCPTNSFEPWTPEEDLMVVEKVNELGTRWSAIAKLIPGRSDNCIKNRWYSGLKNQCLIDSHGRYFIRKFDGKEDKKAQRITMKIKACESDDDDSYTVSSSDEGSSYDPAEDMKPAPKRTISQIISCVNLDSFKEYDVQLQFPTVPQNAEEPEVTSTFGIKFENDIWDQHILSQMLEINQDPFQLPEISPTWLNTENY